MTSVWRVSKGHARVTAPVAPGAAPLNSEIEKIAAYPLFDWLRFVLASLVVVGHAGVNLPVFLSAGMAVKIFFALSGWLIGGILLRTEKAEMPRFFFNRATRIWIPYAVAIVLLYGVALVKNGADFFWFKYLLLDVTFTHQLYTFFPRAQFELPLDGSGNQFWCISVEEQFYLFAPIVMLFLLKGRTLLIWAPIALVTLWFDLNTAAVSLGVCAAILQRDYDISQSPGVRAFAVLAMIGSATTMQFTRSEFIVGPLFAVFTVVAAAVPGLRRESAVIAGGLSYPLYLNAWIAGFAMHYIAKRWFPMSPAVHITAGYILAVPMALGLYWVIDRQVQRYRHTWYSPQLGRRLGLIAYCLVGFGIVAGGLIHRYGPHGVPPGNAAVAQAKGG